MSIQHLENDIPARLTQNDFEFLLPMVTPTDEYGENAAPKTKFCAICGGISACGIHFGVLSCAACAAFFRRTIAEKLTYICRTERYNCPIIHGFTQRKNCRHCRFKKCLAMGMQPQKVQNKRQPTKEKCEQLPQIVKTEEVTSNIHEAAYKYSILQEQRMKHYASHQNQAATMGNYLKIVRSEPVFLSNYFNSSGAFNEFADVDKFSLFKNYIFAARVVEQAGHAVHYGGINRNRVHMIDGSYIGATEIGLTKFYESGRTEVQPPMQIDPKCLARVSLKSAQDHLQGLVAALERLNLTDEEFAALLSLVLWDVAIPELTLHGLESVRKKRQKIMEDLCEYYKSTRMDIQIRLANLILLLSPIQRDVSAWKENLTISELMRAKMLSIQAQADAALYEQCLNVDKQLDIRSGHEKCMERE